MDTSDAFPLPRSVAGVFDVEAFGPQSSPPRLLFEIPHGATAIEHYSTLRERLRSDLPDGLEGFFHVNTDIGAPEVALAAAQNLADAGIPTVVLRSLVPRTFIDCNRALDHPGAGAVTPGLPDYINDEDDRELLVDLHQRYTQTAKVLYEIVCGRADGLAVNLHTYAPRSIALTQIKPSIVEDLRAAYLPDVYRTWPERPEVDLITRSAADELLAPEALLLQTKDRLQQAGFEVKENSTYRLFHATMGYWHSKRWPQKMLCLEMRRDLLAKEFIPFEPMAICPQKVARFVGPMTQAVQVALG